MLGRLKALVSFVLVVRSSLHTEPASPFRIPRLFLPERVVRSTEANLSHKPQLE
jgi:hypothetical protein